MRLWRLPRRRLLRGQRRRGVRTAPLSPLESSRRLLLRQPKGRGRVPLPLPPAPPAARPRRGRQRGQGPGRAAREPGLGGMLLRWGSASNPRRKLRRRPAAAGRPSGGGKSTGSNSSPLQQLPQQPPSSSTSMMSLPRRSAAGAQRQKSRRLPPLRSRAARLAQAQVGAGKKGPRRPGQWGCSSGPPPKRGTGSSMRWRSSFSPPLARPFR